MGLKAQKSMMSMLPRCFPKLLQAPECFCMLPLHLRLLLCHHAGDFTSKAQRIFLQPIEPFLSELWVESGMTLEQVDAKGVTW